MIPSPTPILAPSVSQTRLGQGDIGHTACTKVSQVLSRIGDKWTVLIVMRLGEGPRRFSELKREVDGVSQRMLTLTLKALERDGLVTRTVTPTVPARVDYALTDLGRSLLDPVSALGAWAFAHIPQMDAARAAYDGRTAV